MNYFVPYSIKKAHKLHCFLNGAICQKPSETAEYAANKRNHSATIGTPGSHASHGRDFRWNSEIKSNRPVFAVTIYSWTNYSHRRQENWQHYARSLRRPYVSRSNQFATLAAVSSSNSHALAFKHHHSSNTKPNRIRITAKYSWLAVYGLWLLSIINHLQRKHGKYLTRKVVLLPSPFRHVCFPVFKCITLVNALILRIDFTGLFLVSNNRQAPSRSAGLQWRLLQAKYTSQHPLLNIPSTYIL